MQIYFQMWELVGWVGLEELQVMNFNSWSPLWSLICQNFHRQGHSYKSPFPTIYVSTMIGETEAGQKGNTTKMSPFIYTLCIWFTINFCMDF